MAKEILVRNASIFGTANVARLFHSVMARSLEGGSTCEAALNRAAAAIASPSAGEPGSKRPIAPSWAPATSKVKRSAMVAARGSDGGLVLGASNNMAVQGPLPLNRPADELEGGAGCGGCPAPCPPGAGGCPVPLDGMANGSGDTPVTPASVKLLTVAASCAAILNTPFSQVYAEEAGAFEAAWERAKALAMLGIQTDSDVSDGTTPITLTLNSVAGKPNRKTLGVALRVSMPALGANGTYTVRLVGNTDAGAFDTGDILVQNTMSQSQGVVYLFAFDNVNQGTYYYQALDLPLPATLGPIVTVDGLPAGATATLQTIPTGSPNAMALFGRLRS